jgi:hypothetical protein
LKKKAKKQKKKRKENPEQYTCVIEGIEHFGK